MNVVPYLYYIIVFSVIQNYVILDNEIWIPWIRQCEIFSRFRPFVRPKESNCSLGI